MTILSMGVPSKNGWRAETLLGYRHSIHAWNTGTFVIFESERDIFGVF
jgi:hypothetical protein